MNKSATHSSAGLTPVTAGKTGIDIPINTPMRVPLPLLYLGILALLCVRVWKDVLYPQLAYEDSTHMLSFFFNTNSPVYILRWLNGYISFLPNTIAWLAVQLPLVYAPYFITWPCILFAAFTYFSICHPLFRKYIPEDSYRIAIAIILCAYPLAMSSMVSNLNCMHWNLVCLFTLWSIAGLPDKGRWFFIPVMTLLIISHPLSAAVIPLLLIMLVVHDNRADRLAICYYIATILVYLKTSSTPSPVSSYLAVLPNGLQMFLQRTTVELLLGAQLRQWLYEHNYSNAVSLFGLLLAILPLAIGLLRRAPKKILLTIIALQGTAFAFCLVSASRMSLEEAIGVIYVQRFYYNPRIFFIIATAIALLHGRPIIHLKAKIILPMALLVTGYFSALNYYNQVLYQNWLHVSQPALQLVSQAGEELKKAQQGDSYTAVWTGEYVPDWPIYLDIDCHLHRRPHCYAAEKQRMNKIGALNIQESLIPLKDR